MAGVCRGQSLLLVSILIFAIAASAADNIGCRLAGVFYPKDPTELTSEINFFLGNRHSAVAPVGIIVPGDAYMYIGSLMGLGYSSIYGHRYDLIYIIAASDKKTRGVSLCSKRFLSTPLGPIVVNQSVNAELIRYSPAVFSVFDESFRQNKYVETQLPFIEYLFGARDIVPMVIGNLSSGEIQGAVEALTAAASGKRVLIIGAANGGVCADQVRLKAYSERQIRYLFGDGELRLVGDRRRGRAADTKMYNYPIKESGDDVYTLVSRLCRKFGGGKFRLLRYATSSDIVGSGNKRTSYISGVFYPNDKMPDEPLDISERNALMELVRSIAYKDSVTSTPALFNRWDRVLVTLVGDGEIKGSGGNIFRIGPLDKLTVSATRQALSGDAIHPASDISSCTDLIMKLYILTEPMLLSLPKDVNKYLILYMEHGDYVSMENVSKKFTPVELLSGLCVKAGLLSNCWRDDECRVYGFQGEELNIPIKYIEKGDMAGGEK